MSTDIKERPILFSAPMVRAILDGRKTMARGVVRPQPDDIKPLGPPHALMVPYRIGKEVPDMPGVRVHEPIRCPFGKPGDRLWVRETWALIGNDDGHPVDSNGTLCGEKDAQRIYRADATPAPYGLESLPNLVGDFDGRWTPSIHMPRWASRLTLEVTDVRVERLQDISEADAIAEGIEVREDLYRYRNYLLDGRWCISPVDSFRSLWNSINGPGSWEANPWVWVVAFKRQGGAA